MYERNVLEEEAQPAAAVIRRRQGPSSANGNARLSLRQRLSNIVSVYIPEKGERRGGHHHGDDTSALLHIPEDVQLELGSAVDDRHAASCIAADASSLLACPQLFQSVHKVIDLDKLAEVETIPLSEIISATVVEESDSLYLCLAGSSTLLDISLHRVPRTIRRLPLRLGSQELFPNQILYQNGVLHVSGHLNQPRARLSLLAKFDKDGHFLARTKHYPFTKFGGFDIDSDGSLLVASPQTSNNIAEASSQVFKLSPGYERKAYHINLGSRRARYYPCWVAGHCVGGRAWVSVVRTPTESSDIVNASSQRHRRMLSFPCCPQDDLSTGVRARDWLSIESWAFESLEPAHIVAMGTARLLVLDAELHNLHLITWDAQLNQPFLLKATEPGVAMFSGLCSARASGPGVDDIAYVFTSRQVYQFTFKN